jgi:predicted acetyltransferase
VEATTSSLVELVDATEEDISVLDRLAQLYQYDFSEFDPNTALDDDGRFGWVDWPRFFEEDEPHVFLVRVDGAIAGFASVHSDIAMRDEGERVWWMENFFVMRRFRGRGVGARVATMLFDRFPGTWEVAQITPNVAAQAFWRTVIGLYTGGNYDEFEVADERWHGPVQSFRTPR